MGLGLEMLIIVALLVFIVTGLVNFGIVIWYIKRFGPMMNMMVKHTTRMYKELEEDEA